jgi:outer membrane protein TolC
MNTPYRAAIRLLCRCACLLSALAVAAECAAADGYTLDGLIAEMQHANPQLEQARQAVTAARLQVPQAGALPAPQFSLTEQANTGGPFDFNRDSGFYAYPTLTQPFLWPGKRRLAADVARAQADVAAHQYEALRVQLTGALKTAYYQLMDLRDQLHFMDEDVQRLEQIKQVTQSRYANNAAAFVDYLNAQVSASSLENDRYGLEKQLQQQVEAIDNLLGRDSQQALAIADTHESPKLPAAPLADLIALAQKSNPAIAGGESQVEAADKSVALARKQFWPDFAVSAGAYTDPTLVRLDRSRFYSLGLSVDLPTWGLRKEQAALDQARAQYDGARAGQVSNRQQVDLAVANAYHVLETAIRQVGFTRDRLLPQAQMAFRLALEGYANNGGTAFSDLLTAQTGLRDTELALIRAENDGVLAYVGLTEAIGKDPE